MTVHRLGCALLLWLGISWLALAAQPDASLIAPVDPARIAEQQTARRQALQQEGEAIASSRQELQAQLAALPRQLENLQAEQINQALVEQAEVDAQSARLRQESVLTERDNAQSRINELRKTIVELEAREQLLKNPATDAADAIADRAGQLQQTQQRLAQLRTDLELENLNLTNLRNQIEVAQMRYKLAIQWQEQVERAHRQIQERTRLDNQAELVTRLQTDQSDLQNQANALKQRLTQERDLLSLAAWQRLETELRTLDGRINLLNLDRQLAESAASIARMREVLQNTAASPKQMRQSLDLAGELQVKLQRDETLLQQRLTLYEQQRQLIERRDKLTGIDRRLRDEELELVNQLLAEINQRLGQAQDQLLQIRTIAVQLEADYQQRLRQDLLTRRPYPATVEAWQQLGQSLVGAFPTLFHQIRLSVEATLKALWNAPPWQWLALAALEGVLLWGVLSARRRLRQAWRYLSDNHPGDSFLRQLIQTVLLMARANLLGVSGAAALLLLLWLIGVPQPGLGILMTLALAWVGVRVPASLAWLLLASPRLPEERRQLSLYRLLLCTLIGGGLWATLVTLAHLSDLSETVIGAFDRLFMLYWFWVFIPVLRIRRWVVERLGAHYDERFWFSVLRLGSLLLPLSLLGAALLGLVGYLQLAWLVAGGLLIFIAILALWLLAHSLLNDLIVALKNFAVAHSGYGLLWTQDVITPLHRIANLLLVLAACAALFRAYGWTGESAVIVAIWAVLERPLLTLGGAEITLWRIIITFTLLALVIWLGQWSRAISYRWILSHISDLGVRHSLSVFTQYAMVLIGFLIILQLVGIDLTALAVFAGAVGVGIGLGMQSLANNFISGLLLLIERPLRSGDIVQVGTHLGEVTDIGMRALIVKTFDNESVIIPNADVISNAFTNWTHGDQIHRTILWVGASYEADPHRAQALIEAALQAHPAVLADPEPLVLLWNFADASIRFRVQYYIDLSQNHLLKTHHDILFAVWDRFKEAGIRMPYPQRDLYIKTWPEAEPPPDHPSKPVSLLKKPSQAGRS